MQRAFGIGVGVATQVLFACTVWQLIWFLKGSADLPAPADGLDAADAAAARLLTESLASDALLALFFAVPHSVLLLPAVRARLVKAGIGGAFYGCFFCVVTCTTLLFTILAWQPTSAVAWRWPEPLGTAIAWAFVGCWGALLYSLHLTGLGWQTGWTPWWAWVRGQRSPARPFVPRGAYRFLRHPVYLSFLGLVWLVPVVTLDRAVLIAIWTVYILTGSILKDRRLLFFLQDEYRRYQAAVPGYPGMPAGPLARIPFPGDRSAGLGMPSGTVLAAPDRVSDFPSGPKHCRPPIRPTPEPELKPTSPWPANGRSGPVGSSSASSRSS